MRAFVVVAAAFGCAACSLLVSTSDLTGGAASADDRDAADATIATDADAPLVALDAADAAEAFDASRDPNLVAEYSFEDPDGTKARDSSGRGNDATLVGGASFALDGVRGRALAVHGADFATADSLAGPSFPRSGTLSLWFRYSFPPTDPMGRGIFDKYDNTRAHVFVRRINGVTTGDFQIGLQPVDNGGDYALACSFPAQQNIWTHVVITWDEATSIGACWAGGALLKQAAYLMPFVPTTQIFRLGEGLAGGIDEVRLYDRALTPAEVDRIP